MSRSTLYSPASPSTLSMSTCISERSPTLRKRGKVAAWTTESRTVTSACADPTLFFDQATAVSRTEPLNAPVAPAGKHGGRLRGRRMAFPAPGRVPAGVDGHRLPLHAVDKHAPEIA